MKRYFIYLAYNGKNYCGWQIQPNGITVQQKLEDTLSILLRQPTSIVGAGRTDAGVHALSMVAHFDANIDIDESLLVEKLNRILPKDIAIYKIIPVRADAHARFDAISRTYKYFLSIKKDPFQFELTHKITAPLDFNKMNEASELLFNYRDFTSFSKLHTDVKTNNCKIMSAKWEQENDLWIFTIKADRFLRNMVRAIVGTLLDVGRNKISLDDFQKIIELKNRCKAGSSAPGNALFLTDVDYPDDIFL